MPTRILRRPACGDDATGVPASDGLTTCPECGCGWTRAVAHHSGSRCVVRREGLAGQPVASGRARCPRCGVPSDWPPRGQSPALRRLDLVLTTIGAVLMIGFLAFVLLGLVR